MPPTFLPGYAALFNLFSLYLAIAPAIHLDAVAYAGQIRQFGRPASGGGCCIRTTSSSRLASRTASSVSSPDINTLAALQVMNALLGPAASSLRRGGRALSRPERWSAGGGRPRLVWQTDLRDRRPRQLAGVVVLVAALGAMARLQDARQTRTAHAYVARRRAGRAVTRWRLLHQSHAPCRRPSWLCAGRPRRAGAVAAHLGTLAVAGLVYLVAACWLARARADGGARLATTYAHQGHWWAALWRNLGHDVNAILHAVIAQPRLTGFACRGGCRWGHPEERDGAGQRVLGVALAGWRTAAAFWVRPALPAGAGWAHWRVPRAGPGAGLDWQLLPSSPCGTRATVFWCRCWCFCGSWPPSTCRPCAPAPARLVAGSAPWPRWRLR